MTDQEIISELVRRIRTSAAPYGVVLVDGEPHRVWLDDGWPRFVGNPIVRELYERCSQMTPPFNMNQIVPRHWDNSDMRDLRRFYIEIGYSLSGFLELSANDTVKLALPEESSS